MPLSTDRLSDTDIFIKNVAFELDKLLGAGYVFASFVGYVSVDSGGIGTVPFPLSTVVGAIIAPSSQLANGNPGTYDPVPPASIGLTIGYTGFAAYIDAMNVAPGVVRVGLRTTTAQRMSTGASPVAIGYGSRPVSGGATLVGLAWGMP